MSNYKYAAEASSNVYHLLRTEMNVFPSGRMKCGKLFGYFSEFYYEKPEGKRLCKTCKRAIRQKVKMRNETYKYVTKKGSEVYHTLQHIKKWVWIFGRYAICGKHFWLYERYYYRPKGKRLCNNCKRVIKAEGK